MTEQGRPGSRRRLGGVVGLLVTLADHAVGVVWAECSYLALINGLEDRGVTTTAVIEDVRHGSRGGGVAVTVSFETGHGRVRHDLCGDDSQLGVAGAAIPVRFDPQDPSRVVAADRLSSTHMLGTWLVVLLFDAMFAMGFREVARDRRGRRGRPARGTGIRRSSPRGG